MYHFHRDKDPFLVPPAALDRTRSSPAKSGVPGRNRPVFSPVLSYWKSALTRRSNVIAGPARKIPHSCVISRWKAKSQAKKNSIEFTGLRGNFLDLEAKQNLKWACRKECSILGEGNTLTKVVPARHDLTRSSQPRSHVPGGNH